MRKSIKIYVAVSTVAVVLAAFHSWYLRGQFFTAALHVAVNKPVLMVAMNFIVVIIGIAGVTVKRVFFGSLEDRETEALNEKLGPAIFETLLAMTVFNTDFLSYRFLALFALLLFMKVFHWMLEHRIDFLQQLPEVSTANKARVSVLSVALVVFDVALSKWAWGEFLGSTPTGVLLFAFEFTLLLALAVFCLCKWVVNVYDAARGGHFEGRATTLLYAELVHDGIALVTYLAFFGFVLRYYGVPLHLIRQVYVAFSVFRKRVRDAVHYWHVSAVLEARFPLVLLADMPAGTDPTCIICREDMLDGRLLPCGHILHEHCLRAWLTRQQTCPTCMHPVLQDHPAAAPPAGHAAAAARIAAIWPGRAPAAAAARPPQENHFASRIQQQARAAAAAAAAAATDRPQAEATPESETLTLISRRIDQLLRRVDEIQEEATSLKDIISALQSQQQQQPAPAPPAPPQAQAPAAPAAPPQQQDQQPLNAEEIRRRRLLRFSGEVGQPQ